MSPERQSPLRMLKRVRLQVMLIAYLRQNPGFTNQDFFDRFNWMFARVAPKLDEGVSNEEKAELVASWWEYKLGLRPHHMVDARVLQVLDE